MRRLALSVAIEDLSNLSSLREYEGLLKLSENCCLIADLSVEKKRDYSMGIIMTPDKHCGMDW